VIWLAVVQITSIALGFYLGRHSATIWKV